MCVLSKVPSVRPFLSSPSPGDPTHGGGNFPAMGIGPTAGLPGGAPATVGDSEEDGRWRSCDFVPGARSFEGAQRRLLATDAAMAKRNQRRI
ncbi:hypothetical protein U1Q18_028671 [Sarracenia purpurea var. burkii]